MARPIGVRDGGGDLLGLLPSEVTGAGIEKCANGAPRCKEFNIPKQRQLRNGDSPAQALERGGEGNVDLQRRTGTNVLNGDKQHAVFEQEVDYHVWPPFHSCRLLYSQEVCAPSKGIEEQASPQIPSKAFPRVGHDHRLRPAFGPHPINSSLSG